MLKPNAGGLTEMAGPTRSTLLKKLRGLGFRQHDLEPGRIRFIPPDGSCLWVDIILDTKKTVRFYSQRKSGYNFDEVSREALGRFLDYYPTLQRILPRGAIAAPIASMGEWVNTPHLNLLTLLSSGDGTLTFGPEYLVARYETAASLSRGLGLTVHLDPSGRIALKVDRRGNGDATKFWDDTLRVTPVEFLTWACKDDVEKVIKTVEDYLSHDAVRNAVDQFNHPTTNHSDETVLGESVLVENISDYDLDQVMFGFLESLLTLSEDSLKEQDEEDGKTRDISYTEIPVESREELKNILRDAINEDYSDFHEFASHFSERDFGSDLYLTVSGAGVSFGDRSGVDPDVLERLDTRYSRPFFSKNPKVKQIPQEGAYWGSDDALYISNLSYTPNTSTNHSDETVLGESKFSWMRRGVKAWCWGEGEGNLVPCRIDEVTPYSVSVRWEDRRVSTGCSQHDFYPSPEAWAKEWDSKRPLLGRGHLPKEILQDWANRDRICDHILGRDQSSNHSDETVLGE